MVQSDDVIQSSNADGPEPSTTIPESPLLRTHSSHDIARTELRRKKKEKKKQAKQRDEIMEASIDKNKEEESARTLLEMKGYRTRTPRQHIIYNDVDDDVAASSQVVAEAALRPDQDEARTTEGYIKRKKKFSKKSKDGKRSKRARKQDETGHAPTNDQISQPDEADSYEPIYPDPSKAAEHYRPSAQSSLDQYRQNLPEAMSDSYDEPSEYGPKNNNSISYQPYSSAAQEVDTATERNPRKAHKRQKTRKHQSGADSHSSAAALADAASAANALIDPALTAEHGNWHSSRAQPREENALVEDYGIDEDELAYQTYDQTPATSKRKRRLPEFQGELAGFEKPSTPKQQATKKARTPRTSEAGTDYSEAELKTLTDYMDSYRQDHGMTSAQLNDRVQQNAKGCKRSDFWAGVCALFPNRNSGSVQKVCRRRFHNYEKRGKWDTEDDDALRMAFAIHGKSWKKVGAMLGRMAEDCRDRYRNYIVCGDNRTVGEWTQVEEERLTEAVNECKAAMREQAIDTSAEPADAEEEYGKLLNWSAVSEKMGKTRSRLQCHYKWRKMQESAQTPDGGGGRRVKSGPEATWRTKKAQQNVERWQPGDFYNLYTGLQASGSTDEAAIPWKIIGPERWRRRWESADRRVAFATRKAAVPHADARPLQDIIAILLHELEAAHHPAELQLCCERGPDSDDEGRKRKRLSHKADRPRKDDKAAHADADNANEDGDDGGEDTSWGEGAANGWIGSTEQRLVHRWQQFKANEA